MVGVGGGGVVPTGADITALSTMLPTTNSAKIPNKMRIRRWAFC